MPTVADADVTNLGVKIPASQQAGKAITLQGRIRINDFGTADDVLCLVRTFTRSRG